MRASMNLHGVVSVQIGTMVAHKASDGHISNWREITVTLEDGETVSVTLFPVKGEDHVKVELASKVPAEAQAVAS